MVTGESVCGFLLNSHSTIFRICGQNKKKRSYPGFLHLQIHTYQLTQNSGTSDLCAIPECSHLLLVVHGHDILYGVASWVSGGCAGSGHARSVSLCAQHVAVDTDGDGNWKYCSPNNNKKDEKDSETTNNHAEYVGLNIDVDLMISALFSRFKIFVFLNFVVGLTQISQNTQEVC